MLIYIGAEWKWFYPAARFSTLLRKHSQIKKWKKNGNKIIGNVFSYSSDPDLTDIQYITVLSAKHFRLPLFTNICSSCMTLICNLLSWIPQAAKTRVILPVNFLCLWYLWLLQKYGEDIQLGVNQRWGGHMMEIN